MGGLFGFTLFVSAWLLFAIQPMIGRVLLPKLGGSPAVWNTCLLFFQAILLLGYLYSHVLSRWQRTRSQSILHLILLTVVLLVLPDLLKGRGDPPPENPAGWLLVSLTIAVGLPFFVLATISPLLQKWYADITGRDPYFLSIASNGGSFALLLAYPLLIEPFLDLDQQFICWRWGYGLFLGVFALGVLAIQIGPHLGKLNSTFINTDQQGGPAWLWVLLAFIPSGLLSGVTSSITTDVAPIPLLWVVPLGLYLLTFMIAFAPIPMPIGLLNRLSIIASIILFMTLLTGATEPLGVVLAIHLGTFFILALLCHARLSQERPAASGLTRYYLLLSLGGVLGGAFNALIAPVVFHRFGFVEYPTLVLVACLGRPAATNKDNWTWSDLIAPVVLGCLVTGLIVVCRQPHWSGVVEDWSKKTGIPLEMVKTGLFFGLPLIVCYLLSDRPIRFALALGALLLASSFHEGNLGQLLLIERNFLGVIKITQSPDGQYIRMVHGNTIHGQQRKSSSPVEFASTLSPLAARTPLETINILAITGERISDRRLPMTYYFPTGPAGSLFRYLTPKWADHREIVVVGLGTGALASYGRSNESWTFIELDPAVEKLARDERYFTFLRDSKAGQLRVSIGDGRVKLLDFPDASLDLLILDAFSSDAIPLHLLTLEAFELFRRKLNPNGLILIHLSNRYLNLPPMVAKIASTLVPSMKVLVNEDLSIQDRERDQGKYPSVWVMLAERGENLGPFQQIFAGWSPAQPSPLRAWTDNRTNLIDVLGKGIE